MLKTEWLTLRKWTEADTDSLYEYAKDSDVGPIASWQPHKSREESLDVIRNVFCGAVELMLHGHSSHAEHDDECELGYRLGKPFWWRGLMPEAARELLRHGFEDLGMRKIWCGYYDGNQKSKRVQEKLCFQYHHTCENVSAPLMNEIRTEHISVMTREHWDELCQNNG